MKKVTMTGMINSVFETTETMTAVATILVALWFAGSAPAVVADTNGDETSNAGRAHPDRVYWGDTHLHTNLSVDILDPYSPMGRGLSREDAYRFARGEEVIAHNGMKIRRSRPLDFLVIADHAENLGLHQGVINSDRVLMESEEGRELRARYELARDDREQLVALFTETYRNHGLYGSVAGGDKFQNTVWASVTASADRNNQPGVFTAFIGYEYTSHDFNLHRVVVFRDGAKRAERVLPFSQHDSKRPEDLWAHLERYEEVTAGDVLAIPHNGNLSRGRMFMLQTSTGQPIDRSYVENRNKWEPLYEVTQIKGDSETHPVLSPEDEFADFETWRSYYAEEPGEDAWRKYEYARSALKFGLQLKQRFGINPFKLGLIGSTDSHTSLSSISEKQFIGHGPKFEPKAGRMTMVGYDRGTIVPAWKFSASGSAAVWASENTREAIFDAMERREVYATTGPRIVLRFFGGWDFEPDDIHQQNLAESGYEKGVPMGGDLQRSDGRGSPKFLISAAKDPNGANLDRIQVVKGWLDESGNLHEKVFDVALSDDRTAGSNGVIPPVGSTVDVKAATYTNSIGDPILGAIWEDPDFNEAEMSFYYVRVIEIPTPRWTAYDAQRFAIDLNAISEDIVMVVQERAYSSPIWYAP